MNSDRIACREAMSAEAHHPRPEKRNMGGPLPDELPSVRTATQCTPEPRCDRLRFAAGTCPSIRWQCTYHPDGRGYLHQTRGPAQNRRVCDRRQGTQPQHRAVWADDDFWPATTHCFGFTSRTARPHTRPPQGTGRRLLTGRAPPHADGRSWPRQPWLSQSPSRDSFPHHEYSRASKPGSWAELPSTPFEAVGVRTQYILTR